MSETGESAVAQHDRMVVEEKQQADVLAATAPTPDFWQGQAGRFRPSTEGNNSPELEHLVALTGADGTAIDVGAGGGRLAIPLAERCRGVVAVEPSPAMRNVLQEEVTRRRLQNLGVVAAGWEEAEVSPATLVFSAHVTYGVQSIGPFLRKMDATATGNAAIVTFADPPQAPIAPFWQAVHGSARLRLPCRDELLAALRELGARPGLVPLPPRPPQSLGTREDALAMLRWRLFLLPGSAEDKRLLAAIGELTEERDGELWPRNGRTNERCIVVWQGGSFR